MFEPSCSLHIFAPIYEGLAKIVNFENFECERDMDINFPKLSCINGKCENRCTINNEIKNNYDWNKPISYYEFVHVIEMYYNKQGGEYKRTMRNDVNDVKLKDVYEKLQEGAREYLVHQHHILLDKVYWSRFLDETDLYVTWVDYSQNIKLTEKIKPKVLIFQANNKHSTIAHFDVRTQRSLVISIICLMTLTIIRLCLVESFETCSQVIRLSLNPDTLFWNQIIALRRTNQDLYSRICWTLWKSIK